MNHTTPNINFNSSENSQNSENFINSSVSRMNRFPINNTNIYKNSLYNNILENTRLDLWNRYVSAVTYNPGIRKKDICNLIGVKESQIDSLQKNNNLQSPFRVSTNYHKVRKPMTEEEKLIRNIKRNETINFKKDLEEAKKKHDYEKAANLIDTYNVSRNNRSRNNQSRNIVNNVDDIPRKRSKSRNKKSDDFNVSHGRTVQNNKNAFNEEIPNESIEQLVRDHLNKM